MARNKQVQNPSLGNPYRRIYYEFDYNGTKVQYDLGDAYSGILSHSGLFDVVSPQLLSTNNGTVITGAQAMPRTITIGIRFYKGKCYGHCASEIIQNYINKTPVKNNDCNCQCAMQLANAMFSHCDPCARLCVETCSKKTYETLDEDGNVITLTDNKRSINVRVLQAPMFDYSSQTGGNCSYVDSVVQFYAPDSCWEGEKICLKSQMVSSPLFPIERYQKLCIDNYCGNEDACVSINFPEIPNAHIGAGLFTFALHNNDYFHPYWPDNDVPDTIIFSTLPAQENSPEISFFENCPDCQNNRIIRVEDQFGNNALPLLNNISGVSALRLSPSRKPFCLYLYFENFGVRSDSFTLCYRPKYSSLFS